MCENDAYVIGDSDREDFDILFFGKVGFLDCFIRLPICPSVSDEDCQLGDVRSRFSEQLCSCHAERLQHQDQIIKSIPVLFSRSSTMIGYWHDIMSSVCPSVRLSVTLCIVALRVGVQG